GGDEREERGIGAQDSLRDERRRVFGEPAQAVLLPVADEPTDVVVVCDGRARRGEREAAAGALAAAPHRPRGRRAAALAERRLDPAQAVTAARAELRAAAAADEAALRQEQVEHAPRLGRACCRLRVRSATSRAAPAGADAPARGPPASSPVRNG